MPEKMDFLKPTTLKVLNFFFAHPAAEFHEREVLRSTGISKGSANKILREEDKNFLFHPKPGARSESA